MEMTEGIIPTHLHVQAWMYGFVVGYNAVDEEYWVTNDAHGIEMRHDDVEAALNAAILDLKLRTLFEDIGFCNAWDAEEEGATRWIVYQLHDGEEILGYGEDVPDFLQVCTDLDDEGIDYVFREVTK